MITLKDKVAYYNEQNGTNIVIEDHGSGQVVSPDYIDAISAIDEDMVTAWQGDKQAKGELEKTDTTTIRAIEDILEILREDGVWSDTDPRLKQAAKDKLSLRRGYRQRLSGLDAAMEDGQISEAEKQSSWWNPLSWF